MPGGVRRVIVLGSTGSVGVQTLDVIAHLNALHGRGVFAVRHEVVGLAIGRNAALLAEQRRHWPGATAAVAEREAAASGALSGADAAERLVREVDADVVVAAMAGSAGLPATLAAVELGRDVALANKEPLVAAGAIIVPTARRTRSRLLPMDSEHAALWQCLGEGTGDRGQGAGEKVIAPPMMASGSVARAWITASGGALRGVAREEAYHATPERALRHPTWSMGPKVTIDSATLMNKALEVIEAHWLFGLEPSRIGVLIHPQSIVHAIVEFRDGSSLAHLAAPDMKGPIQNALAFPWRVEGACRPMDWSALASLEFTKPSGDQAAAVDLAYRALEYGGAAGAVLNAANEAAVEAFLARRIPLGRIVELVGSALDGAMAETGAGPLRSLDDVNAASAAARRRVETGIIR
ncbi:MAG: 1-deoxy-D-xylulose-5-phosphate reductoisomerase [Phycisphaerales bacterium]